MKNDPREFAYRIDANDILAGVSSEWLAFARENDAARLTEKEVVGRPLWHFVQGMETQAVYRALLRAARTKGRSFTLPFRCDSPSERRYMELRITPLAGGEVRFVGRLIRRAPRIYLAVFDTPLRRARRTLEMCSFCKKVRLPERGWFEADEVFDELDVFSREELPKLLHTLCDDCADVNADLLEPGEPDPTS